MPSDTLTRDSSAPDAPARGRSSLGLAFAWSEIAVLFRRRRTQAMLGALAAVPVLVAVALKVTNRDSGRGPAFIGEITQNGLFVGIVALVLSIPLFLPLVVGVVAGDTVAGEANVGMLRYLLVSPVGRLRLLLVKYVGVVAFCAAAALVVVLAGTIIGAILFPVGPVTLLSGDTIPISDALGRLALMGLYVAVSFLGMSAIGLFISTLTDIPVGAMAGTVVLSVASQVVDQLPQLDALHPYLFTHYWLDIADLLRQPIYWDSFQQNLILQLVYVAVFGAAAVARFLPKDVLS